MVTSRLLGEPTRAEIEGGCNGNVRIEVRAYGTRAHSARAWVGHNAIHDLAPVLAKLSEYEPREVEVDGLVYREGLNAVGISGGVAGNVIPDEAMVHINYRFAPSSTPEQAVAFLREFFAGFEVTVVDLAAGAVPGSTHRSHNSWSQKPVSRRHQSTAGPTSRASLPSVFPLSTTDQVTR